MKVLQMALAMIGWKKLLGYTWQIVKPQLEKAAKKTETSFDDDCVKVADKLISEMLSDKAL